MDAPESQIEALMQLALHAADVGYRADSARFVVLFTDAPFHVAGDGAAAEGSEERDERRGSSGGGGGGGPLSPHRRQSRPPTVESPRLW